MKREQFENIASAALPGVLNEIRQMTDEEIEAFWKQRNPQQKNLTMKDFRQFDEFDKTAEKLFGKKGKRASRSLLYDDAPKNQNIEKLQNRITDNIRQRSGRESVSAEELEMDTWKGSHQDDKDKTIQELNADKGFKERKIPQSLFTDASPRNKGYAFLKKGEIELSCSGAVFTYANQKLPYNTLIFNMNSALNCPSKECTCRNVCYAKKLNFRTKSAHLRDMRNQAMLKHISLREFLELLEMYIEESVVRINYIRLSEAGDFIDQEQLNTAKRLALLIYNKYKIKTVVYSARHLDFGSNNPKVITKDKSYTQPKFEDYFIVNASNFSVMNPTRYYLAKPKEEIKSLGIVPGKNGRYTDKEGVEHPYFWCHCNCFTCNFCYQSKKENREKKNEITHVICPYH